MSNRRLLWTIVTILFSKFSSWKFLQNIIDISWSHLMKHPASVFSFLDTLQNSDEKKLLFFMEIVKSIYKSVWLIRSSIKLYDRFDSLIHNIYNRYFCYKVLFWNLFIRGVTFKSHQLLIHGTEVPHQASCLQMISTPI